ncbi:hypothetical protein [Mycobacteroides franklinii]|uniref:Uncharacterized protein n=1 Tax=Mycobacteroides franklinii TaxID=948102 RepID=A0A4R5P621_9MYCO|nr:hypothetical protein [Mycobacteroides franklinii]ORA62090.1 hypothetical protein BST24_08045 [Mycobacteroides franklinii]TDH18893.1 hypothetical protein EJ571_20060 [Mycobacteroides franklinii]
MVPAQVAIQERAVIRVQVAIQERAVIRVQVAVQELAVVPERPVVAEPRVPATSVEPAPAVPVPRALEP